ncbi:MAG TPA: cupredoxin domain-containing protein [bacterium]|nr:cupredoxin domain-containing protein [bacterium]
MKGLLETGTTHSADFNLLLQLAMATVLTLGMFLARARRFRAHGWTQSTVLLLNLVAIGGIMLPSLHRRVLPHFVSAWHDTYYAVAVIHAGFGALVELLGLYVVLVAATNIMPRSLRFRNYRLWMRTTLALWWVLVLLGVGVYYVWYVQPSPAATRGAPEARQHTGVIIAVKNFSFTPKRVTVPEGTAVEWDVTGGRHELAADDGSFTSPIVTAGGRFQQKFTKPGVYNYYCQFHGAPGGQDMAGMVIVK